MTRSTRGLCATAEFLVCFRYSHKTFSSKTAPDDDGLINWKLGNLPTEEVENDASPASRPPCDLDL